MPETKITDRYFRSNVTRGIKGGIDKENHIIRGFSVISLGEARGHELEIDDETLNLVVKHGNAKENGIKSRFGHPNMSNSAIGTYLGRVRNFRKDNDRVRADLYISDVAFDSPKGDLGSYVESLAEKEPDMFGSSIVFPIENRIENKGEKGIKGRNGKFIDLARPSILNGVDVVDDPATGDGMFEFFSDTVKPSAEMTGFLDNFLKLPDAMDRIHSFLNRYIENKEEKQKLISLAERMVSMQDEKKEKQENTPKKLMFQLVEGEMDMLGKNDEKKETGLTEAVMKEREEAAAARELERITTVMKLAKKFNIPDEIAKELLSQKDPKLSLEDIAKKLADIDLGKSQVVDTNEDIPDISINLEARDKKLEVLSNLFLVKGGVINDAKIKEEVSHSEFRGMGMKSCVAHFLSEAGVKNVHMLSGDELYTEMIRRAQQAQFGGGAMAQGTGDFTNLLGNTINKSLAKGWNDAPVTYPQWCGSGSLSDFKTADIIKVTAYGDVEEIPEGEAPRSSKLADTKETARLKTYGSYFTLTRQAIINDDLNWFTRVPQRMSSSYRRVINYRVYWYLFNANAAIGTNNWLGPTMTEDGVRLFNAATHRNYLALGSGAAPSEATLTVGWNQMLTQRQASPDNNRSNYVYASTAPKYIIHGPHTTLQIHKLLNSVYYSTSSGDPNDDYQISNIYGPGKPRNLIPVEEVLLDYWVTSTATYPWYLAADPSIVDTITVFGLNGETRPSTSSEPSSIGEAMGMKYQVVGDFGISAIDWRGLYLNTGR
uniref:Major capsid protein n=1 Tax=viral metagenome TaxID=1070528 RepID=A0A6M3LY66_9ZZZZ